MFFLRFSILSQLRPIIFHQVPQPETAGIDIEHQLVQPPSQPQFPSQLEPVVQNHQQWQNAIVGFCFSYALGVSLQFVIPGRSDHWLPLPRVSLSFIVLLVFIFILLAFFIHPKCTMISQALQKAALLLARCHDLLVLQ
ncbi:hypothetical protein V6N13_000822 [Hibiscus sabdariffa]|uniref:Uncharacterized protein n=1 Tax=Hibiscus sabdariffa TaxID=183260 RepID=A0ABR2G6G0_9ROSI